jgi:para-aminobenzoate synthetase/4-amino-4-deoxychorismate lyase
MLVILEGDSSSRRAVYRNPRKLIVAEQPEEVEGALAALAQAQSAGYHAAGWFAYELAYALEPKLRSRMPAKREGPLLKFGIFDRSDAQIEAPAGRAYAGPLHFEWTRTEYAEQFRTIQELIAAGDIYQANLTMRARFAFAGNPRALYEQLRRASAAPYCAYVEDGERTFLSISPELFLAADGQGRLTMRPMKGTAPRGEHAERERAALAANPKDRAENLMIVDLIRNDLGKVAQTGSVQVENLFEVESYPTLHTMVSTVRARKSDRCSVVDVLAKVFPSGSVTGAPKIRAMEILSGLETSERGVYCGSIGHFAPDGSARFNVAIRTLSVAGSQGVLGLGGAIVHDSRPAAEYAECLVKARFFERQRIALELVETMRFESGSGQGFARLERHLARMARSAARLGMRFDDSSARDALQAAVRDRIGLLRVRLSLDESGSYRVDLQDLTLDSSAWTYRIASIRTCSTDEMLRHKTTWRDDYDRARRECGTDEVVFCNERGQITEGSRSNVFVRRGARLLTPPVEAGLLPGCLREELLANGEAVEADLGLKDLQGEVYFGNSLRGLLQAVRT